MSEPHAIYAWVGEDEFGSGKVGIKQGLVPAGMIPLAAMSYHLDRLAKLLPQMESAGRGEWQEDSVSEIRCRRSRGGNQGGVMSPGERAMRLGCYCGLAAVKLGDDSYARQFLGRRMSQVSEAEYVKAAQEIQQRLVAAGIIKPDEDPFDEMVADAMAGGTVIVVGPEED